MAGVNTVEVGAVEWNTSFAIAGLDAEISAGISTSATFNAFAAAAGVLLAPVGAGSAQATDSETIVDLTAPISASAVLAALAAASASLTAATSASETQLSDVEIVAAILGPASATVTMAGLAQTVAAIQAGAASGATWAVQLQAAAVLLAQVSAGTTTTSLAAAVAALAANASAAATFSTTASLAFADTVAAGAAASATLVGRLHTTEHVDEFSVDVTEVIDGDILAAAVDVTLAEQAIAGMVIEGEITGFGLTLLAGAAAGAAFTGKIATARSWAAGAVAGAEFSLPAEVRMLVATVALLARVAASSITLHQTTDLSAVSARYRVIEEE